MQTEDYLLPDAITFTRIISAYAAQGDTSSMMKWFNKMSSYHINPSDIMFSYVKNAYIQARKNNQQGLPPEIAQMEQMIQSIFHEPIKKVHRH
jgi:pentatricopeptide repeat protein